MKKLNLKWKLTLWAAFLILILFFSFNLLQYFVIQNWVISQERQTIQKKMEEVLGYIQEPHTEKEIWGNEHYLDILNEKDQLIRIVGEGNVPLFTISDEVPENWITPMYVTNEELYEVSPKGDRLLIFRKPFEVDGFKGTVEIIRNMESFDSLIQQIFTLMIGTSLAAVILSFVGGRFISFQLLKPINMMIRTMKKIKENGLRERVPVSAQQDEMTELGVMFNDLMGNLEHSFQQQQQFVEDASHELKTPLSIIRGHLSLINRWGKHDPEVLERSLHVSLDETDRLIELVSELLVLSRSGEINPIMSAVGDVAIRPVIENIIDNFKVIHADAQISSTLHIDDNDTVTIAERHFEQILIILLDNAVKYSKEEKLIHINSHTNQNQLTIEVKDYGIGIPEEELPFVMNRFYRVDKARSRKSGGNGLGLSIAKRLVDLYGERIQIESVYGKWTKVTIVFPVKNNTKESN